MRYDAVVIGGGPGGVQLAYELAEGELSVALVEDRKIGGECVGWGCIPTKALMTVPALLHDYKSKWKRLGLNAELSGVDLKKLFSHVRRTSDLLSKALRKRVEDAGVKVYQARGILKGEKKVELSDGTQLEADKVFIATGTSPRALPGLEPDGEKVMDNRSFFDYIYSTPQELPKRVLVIGAGAVGLEIAWSLTMLGSQVTVVELLPRVLPNLDPEIGEVLGKELERQGLKILTSSKVKELQRGEKLIAKLETPRGEEELEIDMVLVSVGRKPNTETMGLEELSVETFKGFVKHHGYRVIISGKPVDWLFAIGDVIGGKMLAHKAATDASILASNLLHGEPIRERVIPSAVFTHPEVAEAGLTEEQAKERYGEVRVWRKNFSELGRSLASVERAGFVKLIFAKDGGEEVLVGGSMVGPHVSDMISYVTLGIERRLTFKEFKELVHPHPTFSEVFSSHII